MYYWWICGINKSLRDTSKEQLYVLNGIVAKSNMLTLQLKLVCITYTYTATAHLQSWGHILEQSYVP